MYVLENTINLLEEKVIKFESEGRNIYLTSSFQTQSLPLLHIVSKHFPKIKVIFIDTGFLFPETYQFKQFLEEKFNLEIITVSSKVSKHQQIDKETGLFYYSLNPDICCQINKVSPLNDFFENGDVWISGVRRDQSEVRKSMNVIEYKDNNVIKFHPMLDWNSKNIHDYIKHYNLPKHPLENKGYVSIGCVPCTHKWNNGQQRGGRWLGSKKTECGLHLNNNK